MKNRSLLLGGLVLAVCAFPAYLCAYSCEPRSLRDILLQSGAIVIGMVTGVEERLEQQGDTRTYVTLAVGEVIKGLNTGQTIEITTYLSRGPEDPEWGLPGFSIGEKVLLPLARYTPQPGVFRLTDLLTKFTVINGRIGGKPNNGRES